MDQPRLDRAVRDFDVAIDGFEQNELDQLAPACHATAASVVRLDRSGRNKREADGLLFEQVAKWGGRNTWKRCGDEFYDWGGPFGVGVTGDACVYGGILNVDAIVRDGQNWSGQESRYDLDLSRPELPSRKVGIKGAYCEPIEGLIGAQLREMAVVPIQFRNLILGAIKLLNHSDTVCPGGFRQHLHAARDAAERIAEWWVRTSPIRCDIACVFIDVADSTSFLGTSGYYGGARLFQMFTGRLETAISEIEQAIRRRSADDHASSFGGVPFLENFTGDGVLALFPYDRIVVAGEHDAATARKLRESDHVWPHIRQFIAEAFSQWRKILETPNCRRALREAAFGAEPLKVAVSSGPAYLAKYGGHLSAIGRPLIEAGRILARGEDYRALNDAMRMEGTTVGSQFFLASQQFRDDFDRPDAREVGQAEILRGLPGRRPVYRVNVIA